MYEPGEDSFLLRKTVLEYVKKSGATIALDMGAGTGIQGLALLDFAERVVFSDISTEAINHVKSIIPKKHDGKAVFFVGDLFKPFPPDYKGSFGLIVFNPPYLPLGGESPDPELVGGVKGVEVTIEFLSESKEYLSSDGVVFFVASSLSDLRVLEEKMASLDFKFVVVDKEHYFFEDILIYKAWLSNR